MGVPLRQQIAVGTYLIKQKLKGVKISFGANAGAFIPL